MEKGRVRNGGSYFRPLWFSCYQKKTLTHVNTVCLIHTEEREREGILLPWEQIAVILKVNKDWRQNWCNLFYTVPYGLFWVTPIYINCHLFDPRDYCVQNFCIIPWTTDIYISQFHIFKKKKKTPTTKQPNKNYCLKMQIVSTENRIFPRLMVFIHIPVTFPLFFVTLH